MLPWFINVDRELKTSKANFSLQTVLIFSNVNFIQSLLTQYEWTEWLKMIEIYIWKSEKVEDARSPRSQRPWEQEFFCTLQMEQLCIPSAGHIQSDQTSCMLRPGPLEGLPPSYITLRAVQCTLVYISHLPRIQCRSLNEKNKDLSAPRSRIRFIVDRRE